jgi:hemerythrin
MALFSWTSALATGNAFMDAEHHVLVERVDAVLEAISQARSKDSLIDALADLSVYTREHFALEEEQMQRIQYAGSLEHIAEHRHLLEQVEALKAKLDSDQPVDVMEYYSFLTRWVKDHIMQVDTQLALALQACTGAASHSA